jgi:hypothetical protein
MSWQARFGELRSIAHGEPTTHAWWRLIALVRALCAEGPEAREIWDEQIVPYLDEALERWPAHLRNVPSEDHYALVAGSDAPLSPMFTLSRALTLADRVPYNDRWRRLLEHPALARITHLNLRGHGIDAPQLVEILGAPHLANLRSLDLKDCGFGAAGARHLFGARQLTGQLTSLKMHACPVGRGRGCGIYAMDLSRLDLLELTGCGIKISGVRALANHPDGPSPRHLVLDGLDMMCPDAWRALIRSERLLARVEFLEIRIPSQRYHPNFSLSALLDRCPPLRRLELCMSSQYNPALAHALAHPSLATLRSLRTRLYSRAICRTAVLLNAPFISGLRELDLSESQLRDDDVRAIATCDELSGLESFRFDSCRFITPADLALLLSSPYLPAAARAQIEGTKSVFAGPPQ